MGSLNEFLEKRARNSKPPVDLVNILFGGIAGEVDWMIERTGDQLEYWMMWRDIVGGWVGRWASDNFYLGDPNKKTVWAYDPPMEPNSRFDFLIVLIAAPVGILLFSGVLVTLFGRQRGTVGLTDPQGAGAAPVNGVDLNPPTRADATNTMEIVGNFQPLNDLPGMEGVETTSLGDDLVGVVIRDDPAMGSTEYVFVAKKTVADEGVVLGEVAQIDLGDSLVIKEIATGEGKVMPIRVPDPAKVVENLQLAGLTDGKPVVVTKHYTLPSFQGGATATMEETRMIDLRLAKDKAKVASDVATILASSLLVQDLGGHVTEIRVYGSTSVGLVKLGSDVDIVIKATGLEAVDDLRKFFEVEANMTQWWHSAALRNNDVMRLPNIHVLIETIVGEHKMVRRYVRTNNPWLNP